MNVLKQVLLNKIDFRIEFQLNYILYNLIFQAPFFSCIKYKGFKDIYNSKKLKETSKIIDKMEGIW